MAFTQIPILDLSQARNASTKHGFLSKLRDTLLNVGFLYIEETGIDQHVFDRVCDEGIAFFDLSDERKLKIEMKNKASFLGYSRVDISVLIIIISLIGRQLGNEVTARKVAPQPLLRRTYEAHLFGSRIGVNSST